MRSVVSGMLRTAAIVMVSTFVVASPATLQAQTPSASASGVVRDIQGASLAGAMVTLTSTSQADVWTTLTDEWGRFFFSYVRPDTYTLRISLTGFQTLERTPLVINANDRYTTGILTLPVGAMTESVVVEGRAAPIQAASGERSHTLERTDIRNIGVKDRSFFGLVALVPGVVTVADPPRRSSDFSANGQRINSNNVTIDGITNLDTGDNGGPMVTTNLEAVSEFKVLTSSYQAEYGRAFGAQVQVVTRSGTQKLSGGGYWFGQRSGWNANTWLNNRSGIPKTDTARNDYGYTAGGPVFLPGGANRDRKKAFFFFSQEYQRRRDPVGEERATVPTALERRGDFSQSIDGDGNPFPYIRDYTSGLPCDASDTRGCFRDQGVLGRIPSDRLYGPSLAALSLYPLPNASGDPAFNYRSQQPAHQPRREDLLRLDYNVSDAWRVAGRYMQHTDNRKRPYGDWAMGSHVPTLDGRTDVPGRNWMLSVLGILSPTTSLEITVGSAHNSIDIYSLNQELTRSAGGVSGLPMLFPDAIRLDTLPHFRFQGSRIGTGESGSGSGGAAEFETASGPFSNFNTTYDVVTNATRTIGPHAIKAGVHYQRSLKDQSTFAPFNGLIDFQNDSNNPFDTGHPYSNAATGVYHTFLQASSYAKAKWRYTNVEWFVQDTWRATNRLTLDYGLRFSYMTPQWDVSRQASTFLPEAFDRSVAVRLFQPALVDGQRVGLDPVTGATVAEDLIGRVIPGSGDRFNGTRQAGIGVDETLSSGAKLGVGPRVGLAYDVSADQSVLLRGAFAIAYDRPQGNIVFDLIRNPPGVQEQQLTWGRFQELTSGLSSDAPISLTVIDDEWELPKLTSWNVGMQFKLPRAFALDLAYVGSETSQLPQQRQINAVPYGATFLADNQDASRTPSSVPGATSLPSDFLRPYQGYGDIRLLEFRGFSNYHALQTTLNRRFDRGVSLGITYVRSKALGTGDGDFSAARIDGRDREANYAPLWFDRPHHLVANFVYQTPVATEGALGALVNDWQLSGVYRWMSGGPYAIDFSIPGITAANLTGSDANQHARVVLTGDPGNGWSDDPYRQIDTSVFAPPQPGSRGLESARYFLYGPPMNNLDLSVSKSFRLRRGQRIEVRLDAFNALNHTQFSGVNNTVNFHSLDDPTITNLPYDAQGTLVRPNGFGTVNDVRPARQLQLVTRFSF